MKNEFIPYEEALALKKLGFNEPVYTIYTKSDKELFEICKLRRKQLTFEKVIENEYVIPAPLYQQAFRWFREKGYHCGIILRYDEFHYFIKDFVNDKEYDDIYNITSYEEAELACLKKLIEIVNQNKDE